jgi:hypothetical protein
MNPGLNAAAAAESFAPEVLAQAEANGIIQQTALRRTGP